MKIQDKIALIFNSLEHKGDTENSNKLAEILKDLEKAEKKGSQNEQLAMPCYMMATKATHKLGDISRKEEDLCYIHEEDEENYIGSWVTGFGFISVKFSKKTTRLLTNDEIKKYNKLAISISDGHAQKLCVGKEA